MKDGKCSPNGMRSNFDFERISFFVEVKEENFYYILVWVLFPLWLISLSPMGTKIKGIYKGFKYSLSQIFVVKEREMEIGFPTDVKHVAHIGWDGPSGSAPSWMNEFKTGPDFAATSIGNSGSVLSPWSSQDFGESRRQKSKSNMFGEEPSVELPNIPKKPKRKKSKSTSSPKSVSTSRSSRATKSKSKLVEGDSISTNIEVA